MFDILRNLHLRAKIVLLGVGSVLLAAVALVSIAAWLSGQYNTLAQQEVDRLIEADLDHITQGVYNLVKTENDAVQQQVNVNLNVARHVLHGAGGVSLSAEEIAWRAVNQFSGRAQTLSLPRMLIGGKPLPISKDPSALIPVVDEVTRLAGETATIFQRMNEAGDMIRVATTVRDRQGKRALGTYIPARHPDGTANPVISAILKGKAYRGRAYVVDGWYLTAYKPIRDPGGKLVGMLYVGVRQNAVEARIRDAILRTTVGKTGYVYVLGSQGEERGRYIVSQEGKRDREIIWDEQDSDGRYVVRDIIAKARNLPPGEMTTIRYRWQNPGDGTFRWKVARLAYFEPWDWVIGTSTYEDELQAYRAVLVSGRVRMTAVMAFAGVAITLAVGLIGSILAWTLLRPLRQMQEAVEQVMQGDLTHTVAIRTRDEIGVFARAFNTMTGRLGETLRELRASETKYRTMFDNVQDVFYRADAQGNLIMISPSAVQLFGFDFRYLGRPVASFYADPNARDLILREIMEKGRVVNYEVDLKRIDGTAVTVETSSHVYFDEQGRVAGVEGVFRDITERKRIENELLREKAFTEKLLESLPGIFFLYDATCHLKRWNKAHETATGFSADELRDWYIPDWHETPEDAALGMALVKSVIETGVGGSFETTLINKEGRFVPYLISITRLLTPDGPFMMGVGLDITERKRSEDALRDANERFRSVLQAATGYAIVGADIRGVITVFNDGAEQMLGYTAEEVIGKATPLLFHDPEEIARVAAERGCEPGLATISDPVRERGTETAEWTYVRKDGTRLTVSLTMSALRRDGGEFLGIMGVARDITGEKAMEEQILQSQKMESLGMLAGGVAHDFNNLLTPILGYTELLLNVLPEDSPYVTQIRQIISAASRAKELTQRLLAFGRKQIFHLTSVDLDALVRQFEAILRRTIRENIQIDVRLEPSPHRIRADAGQLEQVLLNLAVNAQDAMPGGGVLIVEVQTAILDGAYTSQHPEVVPGAYVMLAVSDTGTGILPAIREKIFDPFFTTKEKGQGTGLGLSTVYGIVKQHGGSISVYSEVGQGTAFKIYFPQLADTLSGQAVSSTGDHAVSRGTETVLVVDDDAMVRNIAASMLERLGYRVLPAENLEVCEDLLRTHPERIDLLLTDVIMPRLNGPALFELLHTLRPDMKVLYMSGYTGNIIGQHGVVDEDTHFIQKPFSVGALAEKVRQVLDEREGSYDG